MKIRLAEGLALPDDVLEDVTAIVGRRGRGKTNTATVLVEEAHRARMRFVVIDPVGVWWGLRSSKDGKAPGIPCVVMGGEHPMTPLEPTSGQVVADFVTGSDVAGVVLDFRLMRKGEMVRFARTFLERLYLKNREDLLVVIDEADKFAPQRAMGEDAFTLGACEDVVKMGRARGLHAVLITQRPATLNKNVLSQAGILIAHGLTASHDRKAVEAWIDERADEAGRDDVMGTLAGLARGDAWVWAPERGILKRVSIRARETFDSSATPERGKRRAEPKVLAPVDLEKLTAEIRATVERQKADDPKALRAEIAALKAQLAAAAKAVPPAPKGKEIKVHILKASEVKRLEVAVERLLKESARYADAIAQRQQVVVTEAGILSTKIEAALVATRNGGANAQAQVTTPRGYEGAGRRVGAVTASLAADRPAPLVPRPRPIAPNSSEQVGVGERTVLTAIAQYSDRGGVTREQLSILTGYKRSTRDRYVQYLVAKGYADLGAAPNGNVFATGAGIAMLGDFEPLPTGADLRVFWKTRLPEGERRIFEECLAAYPQAIARESLEETTGYKRSTRDRYIQFLQTRKLVEAVGRGALRASGELFA